LGEREVDSIWIVKKKKGGKKASPNVFNFTKGRREKMGGGLEGEEKPIGKKRGGGEHRFTGIRKGERGGGVGGKGGTCPNK